MKRAKVLCLQRDRGDGEPWKTLLGKAAPFIDESLKFVLRLGKASTMKKTIWIVVVLAFGFILRWVFHDDPADPISFLVVVVCAMITLKGSAFGMARGNSAITFGGVNADLPVKSWSDTEITFVLEDPALNLAPAKKPVGVIVSSQKSNSVTLTVLRNPTISDFRCTGDLSTFTLTGSGFGNRLKDDVIKVNNTVADTVSQWTDQIIVFAKIPRRPRSYPVQL
jgi:hypothetical protein